MQLILGLLLPFIGTTLGAACVFFLKDEPNIHMQKILLGFASGIMVAASVWSLLMPSIRLSEGMGQFAFIPALTGFVFGILFFLGMDRLIPHIHINSDTPEGPPSRLKRTTMLVFAVTLHNVPEGMAVGIVFASAMSAGGTTSLAGAIALAIGIAIQNFPEGAIISLPLGGDGSSKIKAFLNGVASGIVEPAAAVITILLSRFIIPILPYLLAFAAGAMIYVVIEELLPEASAGDHSDISTIGFAIGFAIMMVLDVALG